jgi:hypothetical protein
MPRRCAPGTTKPRPYEGRGFARAGRLPFAGGAVAVAVQLATEAWVAAVQRRFARRQESLDRAPGRRVHVRQNAESRPGGRSGYRGRRSDGSAREPARWHPPHEPLVDRAGVGRVA